MPSKLKGLSAALFRLLKLFQLSHVGARLENRKLEKALDKNIEKGFRT